MIDQTYTGDDHRRIIRVDINTVNRRIMAPNSMIHLSDLSICQADPSVRLTDKLSVSKFISTRKIYWEKFT